MTEEKVKKRGWVKNAAIIFLSVLLVLTFFSNTFMNRTLPEVAVQTVTNGTISAQIRGTGTVTATESFEVKSAQSRTVLSVPVQVGDQVKVGDTLLFYADAESEDLKAAEDALDTEMLAYQTALINSATGQYSEQKRAIEQARADLDASKAERDANLVTQEQLASTQEALTRAKNNAAIAEAAYNTAQTNLDNLGGKQEGTTGDYGPVNAAKAALDSANQDLAAKKLNHQAKYNDFKEAAKKAYEDSTEAVAMKALAEIYSGYKNDELKKDEYAQYIAYKEITDAQAEVDACKLAYDQALNNYYNSSTGSNVAEYNRLKKIRDDALATHNTAKATQETAQIAYDDLQARKAKYDEASANVKAGEKALQDAMFNYEKSAALDNLNLGAQKEKIAELQAALDGLRNGGQGATVTSQVNGVVAEVGVSAGSLAESGATLMKVEVPDMGYTLSIPVTNEQSKRVRVGDTGSILYNWGGDITATLAGIRSDPKNPTTNKMLVFKLSGDGVQSGAQLTVSIGEKGASYDAVVPNSAIRSDNNGSFVLVVEAKSTALGNRYTATRVDVQVAAKDDVNSAVTGGLAPGDYVITTSTKPIESGMKVRLPD